MVHSRTWFFGLILAWVPVPESNPRDRAPVPTALMGTGFLVACAKRVGVRHEAGTTTRRLDGAGAYSDARV